MWVLMLIFFFFNILAFLCVKYIVQVLLQFLVWLCAKLIK